MPPVFSAGIRFNAFQYCPEFLIMFRSPTRLSKSIFTPVPCKSCERPINSLPNCSELYLYFPSNFAIRNKTPNNTTGSLIPSVHCTLAHFYLKFANGFFGISSFLFSIVVFFVKIELFCYIICQFYRYSISYLAIYRRICSLEKVIRRKTLNGSKFPASHSS